MEAFVFIESLLSVQRGKVATEGDIMASGRVMWILRWKVHELSCLENNKAWHGGLLLCNQGSEASDFHLVLQKV